MAVVEAVEEEVEVALEEDEAEADEDTSDPVLPVLRLLRCNPGLATGIATGGGEPTITASGGGAGTVPGGGGDVDGVGMRCSVRVG